MKNDKKKETKKNVEAFMRQNILDAVIGLLMRNGIQGFTMDHVAEEAGVAKGTLYVHFSNKEDILDAALESTFDPLFTELSAMLDGDCSPDGKLAEFAFIVLRFFDRNRELIHVFIYDKDRGYEKKRPRFEDSRYRYFVQRVAGVLDEGAREGRFVPMDATKVAAMIIEAVFGVLMQRIHDRVSGDIEKDAKQIMSIFMEGLMRRR